MGADGQDALGGDLCSVKNSPRANAVKTSRKVMSLAGRQFETASRTEPSADQSGCRHQRERPANHDRIGVGAIRHILRTQDLPWVGDQSRQQMNADGKSGARSRRSFVAERAPILQSRSRSPLPGKRRPTYFGQGGSPGLPHACGCATGGWTRTTGGG
jgi:hypothetical protein